MKGAAVPYVEGRVMHDADAHVMETADWVLSYADPAIRDRLEPLAFTAVDHDTDRATEIIEGWIRKGHEDPDLLAREEAEIMQRKNWKATGAFLRDDRSRALDILGFASQLVFSSFHNGHFTRMERAGADLDLIYGTALAHDRAMRDFCADDVRLLATNFIPLTDFDRARDATRAAIDDGAAALLVASACPPDHSPSHLGLDPVWAQAEEAGVPIVFHVGGGGRLLDPRYLLNGFPIPPDFHGGDENFRSVDFMAIPGPPMQTLATMIFDGVLERFPDLRIGVIEQGAGWLPSWMRQMDAALTAFVRLEERLQNLSLRPSEFVQRQIRATPYPMEDVGWIVDQAGPEVALFSSDYPHVEGGRRPVEHFEQSLGDRSDAVRQRFFCDNFLDLMGNGLPSELRTLAA
jgi:predicted TIM-barrel fold metal-dependent hydrolase